MAHTQGSDGLDRVNRIAVVVATSCAVLFFALLALSAVASGRTDLAAGSLTPGLVAVVGLWQLSRPHPRAVPQLLTGGVMTVFYMHIVDSAAHDGGVAALVTMGMTGLLFLRRGRIPYVAAFAGAIAADTLMVDPTGGTAADRVMSTAGSVLLFLFAAAVVVWLRRELETGRARYRSLFERAPAAIWEADFSAVRPWLEARRSEGVSDLGAYLAADAGRTAEAVALVKVLDVNEAALRLLEATRKRQLVGRVDPNRVGPEFLEVAARQLTGLWEGRCTGQHETETTTLRGRTISIAVSWTIPRVRDEPDLGSVVTTVSDVTELKQAERRLERLIESKDEFVASVSHELRTPLTTVVGLACELDARYHAFSGAERRELIGLIADQASEMAYLTEDLLVAARRDGAEVAICPEPVDVRVELARVLRDLGRATSRIHVRLDVDRAEPPCWADPGRVRQILRNLLVNALRHGGPEVGVEVTTDRAVEVAIRDDGAEIPLAERSSIFEPYHRVEPSSGLPASVGLGLTVSRQLARRMAGDVIYERSAAGNVFTLRLPLAAQPAAPVPTPTQSGPSVRLW